MLRARRNRETSLDWDEWLLQTPLGQFPQSERWARVKAVDGWRRHHVWIPGPLRGGFQILWTVRKGFLRIGYVSKGPVLEAESPEHAATAVKELKLAAAKLGLHALMVQPPDRSRQLDSALQPAGFLPNRLEGVVEANLEIDLARDWKDIEHAIHPMTRKKIRQAERRGVRVKEGSAKDLPEFFHLMGQTCRRQQTQPNPGSLSALEAVWAEFQPRDLIRLTFAEIRGKVVAGLLCLCWGATCAQWKKGWDEESSRNEHPNHLLCLDAIRWAWGRGYRLCDFQALSRSTGQRLLDGGGIDNSIRRSRDFFNLGFGGRPVLLPPARVYIPNPLLRLLYRIWAG